PKSDLQRDIGTLDLKDNEERFEVKFFVKNLAGWYNLLKIFHLSSIHEEQYVTYDEIKKHSEGIIFILPAGNHDVKRYKQFKDIYVQFNPTVWSSDETDKKHLLDIQKLVLSKDKNTKPIILVDSYYLDKDEYEVKGLLNSIVKGKFHHSSKDQFFKDKDYIIEHITSLFSEKNQQRGFDYMSEMIDNLDEMISTIDFKIPLGKKYLPDYEMNEPEKKLAKDNKALFEYYCKKLFKEKIQSNKSLDIKAYKERLELEKNLIIEGNVVDYFLILKDIVDWCKERNILLGIGRGSAAGSLVSYMFDITHLDPIKYNLLFERFLNKARLLTGALPDIDEDVPSNHRQDIINYVMGKYGEDQVACIGTSQNFKLKSLLKDVLKLKGVDFSYANLITSFFTKEYDFAGVEGIYQMAAKEQKVKDLINQHHDTIELMDLCMFQPRSFGI
ncbi:MAG: hypothetical protein AABY22_06540, partial [Nanoarchaeota archaeon]